jgi:hypothetical protein
VTPAEEHQNAIRFDYPMFSEVMTAKAFSQEPHAPAMAAPEQLWR